MSESWSDNIELSNDDKETEFVTRITPGVAIVGDGGRVNLNLDYQLGLVHYARGTGSNRLDHRLQATGDAELVRQRVFLDFSSTAGQNNIASIGTQSDDTISVNSNRRNFFTFSVSPSVVHHFGPWADGVARLTHSRVFNSGSTNTNVTTLSSTLTSGRRFASLPWSISASQTRNSNSTGTSSEFRSFNGSISRAFNRHYSATFSLGYSEDELTSGDTDSSVTWRVTGTWTPSARTNVAVGYGSQPFGNSISVDASHRMRRAVFNVGYSESRTTTAAQQLETELVTLEDIFGEEIEDPGLADFRIPITSATLTDETLISRNFAASMGLRMRRTSTTVSLFHNRREFEISPDEETVFGLSAQVSHSLSRNTSLGIGGSWQRSEFDSSGREDEFWRVDLSLSRQFNPDVSGTLGYAHRENDSSVSTSSYKENRVDARLSVLF